MIRNHKKLEFKIKEVLFSPEAIIYELKLDPEEKMYPKVSSEKEEDGTAVLKPLEDMYPFLPREEFKRDMEIDILQ